MRLSRIYCTQSLLVDKELLLGDDIAHYLGKVLRLRPDDVINLFNERDGEYRARLRSVEKKTVTVFIESVVQNASESRLAIHLGLGLSRGERMDYAIQKATELGVTSIWPLLTERCEVKLKADRVDNRLAHWERVAISACEQAGRYIVPKINVPMALQAWLERERQGSSFVLDHRAQSGLSAPAAPSTINFLIGPEGGLSEEEVSAAQQHGFTSVRLGPRVLRTETAPVVAISLAQHLWGDF